MSSDEKYETRNSEAKQAVRVLILRNASFHPYVFVLRPRSASPFERPAPSKQCLNVTVSPLSPRPRLNNVPVSPCPRFSRVLVFTFETGYAFGLKSMMSLKPVMSSRVKSMIMPSPCPASKCQFLINFKMPVCQNIK